MRAAGSACARRSLGQPPSVQGAEQTVGAVPPFGEQRAVIDQAAAVAILQSWLDERLAAMAGTQEGSDA